MVRKITSVKMDEQKLLRLGWVGKSLELAWMIKKSLYPVNIKRSEVYGEISGAEMS